MFVVYFCRRLHFCEKQIMSVVCLSLVLIEYCFDVFVFLFGYFGWIVLYLLEHANDLELRPAKPTEPIV